MCPGTTDTRPTRSWSVGNPDRDRQRQSWGLSAGREGALDGSPAPASPLGSLHLFLLPVTTSTPGSPHCRSLFGLDSRATQDPGWTAESHLPCVLGAPSFPERWAEAVTATSHVWVFAWGTGQVMSLSPDWPYQ